MIEKFERRAVSSILLAQDEALRMGSKFVEPEHLLLGLIAEGRGLAARVLKSFGVELNKARQKLQISTGSSALCQEYLLSEDEPLSTEHVEQIQRLAWSCAKELGHSYIGSEHLLVGLIDEGTSGALGLLSSFGISLTGLRRSLASRAAAVRRNRPMGARVSARKAEASVHNAILAHVDQMNENELRIFLIVNFIGSALEADRCVAICHADSTGTPYVLEEYRNPPTETCVSLGWPSAGSSLLRRVAADSFYVFTTYDVGSDSKLPQVELSVLSSKSFLGVRGNSPYDIFAVLQNDYVRQWTRGEIALVRRVADRLSMAPIRS